MPIWTLLTTIIIPALSLLAPPAARADTVAEFYKNKTISIFIGAASGGVYSNMAQTLARHMERHTPGTPNIIVRNMLGGGGLIATNHVYNVAPKDGTALLMPSSGLTKRVILGEENTKYDPTKFQWLGSWGETLNGCTVLKTAPATTIAEAREKELIIGAIDVSSTTYANAMVVKTVLGAKFNVVPGYPGGAQIRLAMERGELHGFCSPYETWTQGAPDWLKEGRLVTMVQFSGKRSAELPDVPTAIEFARNDEDREMLGFIQSGPEDRAMAAPPDVPADRIAALEKAFMATLSDTEFLTEATAQSFTIDPRPASEIRAYVTRLTQVKPEIVGKVKTITGRN